MKQTATIFVVALIASLLFLSSWQNIIAQRGYPLGFDIYLRWEAARAFWQGQSPYSEEVTARSDRDIYSRSRNENEVAYAFYDPAYAAIVLSPLALMPLEWVGVFWSALGSAILMTLIVSWSWQIQPRPNPLLWGILIISGLFFRPALMTILNGQYSLFLVGCAAMIWYLMVRKQFVLAGILLAVSTIKPSIFLFVPLVLLLWSLRWKIYSLTIAFVGTLMVLGIMTIIQIGWWIPDFLSGLTTYNQVLSQQIGFSWSAKDITSFAGLLWLGQSLFLLAIGLRRLWHTNEIPWLACLAALNLNLIFTPHIVEYDLGILLMALFWPGTKWANQRWGIFTWLCLMWVPWLSWFAVIGLGGNTLQWQNIIWQIFPNILLFATWFQQQTVNKFSQVYQ